MNFCNLFTRSAGPIRVCTARSFITWKSALTSSASPAYRTHQHQHHLRQKSITPVSPQQVCGRPRHTWVHQVEIDAGVSADEACNTTNGGRYNPSWSRVADDYDEVRNKLAWAKVHSVCCVMLFPKFHYNDLLPTCWQLPRLWGKLRGNVFNGFWAL